MKATQRDFSAVAPKAALQARIAFFCGPDEAGAAAAADKLAAMLPDPGERVELSGGELRSDPVRLGDEARSVSLFGGTRHLLVRANGDEAHDAVKVFLEVIDGGEAEGACSVLIDERAFRACTIPLLAVGSRRVTTLEGLGDEGNLHPVQQAFIDAAAAQCGYCLNGMIIATVALLKRNPTPGEADIREELRHNLCRCGTHIEILAAVRRAAGLSQAAEQRKTGRRAAIVEGAAGTLERQQ